MWLAAFESSPQMAGKSQALGFGLGWLHRPTLEHKQVDNISIFKSLCEAVRDVATKETQNHDICSIFKIVHMLHLSVVAHPSLCVDERRMTSQLFFGSSWFSGTCVGLVHHLSKTLRSTWETLQHCCSSKTNIPLRKRSRCLSPEDVNLGVSIGK